MIMKSFNKIASFFCAAALGIVALTSCEGGELYNVLAPDWITSKADSIANAKDSGKEEVLEGMMEDVYNIGKEDLSSGFFTLGKTYVVPAGAKWQAQFNLTVNPDNMYYKNFYVVLYNGDLSTEYGVIRYDNDPKKNSEWNTKGTAIDRSLVSANFTNSSGDDAIDPSVQDMNGKITLTVDRSNGGLFIKMTNGNLTKTYTQTKPFPDAEGANADIACRIGIEQSLVSFLSTNIVPVEGCTSAEDKQPATLTITGVPVSVTVGTPIEEAMKDVTGVVTFEDTPATKDITAADLHFNAIPDYNTPGEKTLVAIYNKTYKGENAEKPVMATATFKVVNEISSIELTKAPATYYYCTSDATKSMSDRTLVVNGAGMEVTATYVDGSVGVVDPAALTYSPATVPAKAGSYDLTITTGNGKTVTTKITVEESKPTAVTPNPTNLGAEDNSTGWWSAFTDDIKVPAGTTYQVNFTNYAGGSNWNNYVIILRKADLSEYAVVRADNYGWGAGYDGNATLQLSGGQADWAAWLAAMNGANCKAYITNCGNGTADIQIVMNGADGNVYNQYYLGIQTIDPNDLQFAFTVDGSHIVFGNAGAKRR